MEPSCTIKNGLGFPVGVYGYFDIDKIWLDGVRCFFLPKEKDIQPKSLIPCDSPTFSMHNLPEKEEDVWLIVSEEIKNANPGRVDLMVMHSLVLDSENNICGCLAFA